MYESVLVADRGETARRVIRTVRAMGLKAVAVYAADDGAARHVHEADEAVLLGSARQDQPYQPYQDIRALIEAAQRSGCQAVHPGCGELSTSPAFAEAVTEGGLVWVGPAPRTLAAVSDPAVLAGALSAVGTAFGGSVDSAADPAAGVAVAVPVLAGDGQPVGLPPRELLRAGQPVVECPAPGLSATAAAAAVSAAEQAVRAVELRGLATVTVVVRKAGQHDVTAAVAGIWPALDVEHPVVEAVTGLDLVEQQVLLSVGGRAALPVPDGSRAAAMAQVWAAVRSRRTKISTWREPQRDDVRVDSGFAAGDTVPPGGARVLATVTGSGRSRDDALEALADALETFFVAGPAVDLHEAQQEAARRRATQSEEQGS